MMKFTQKTSKKSDFLSVKGKCILITNVSDKGIEEKSEKGLFHENNKNKFLYITYGNLWYNDIKILQICI